MERLFHSFANRKKLVQHPGHTKLPDWELLSRTSAFDVVEVKRLYQRYSKICLEDGLISQARFMFMPEVAHCPFAAMAFNHEMEQARRDHLDFTLFVRILSKLSPKSTPLEKAEYFFDVLQIDFDNRGLLEKDEVLIMYKNLSGGVLSQAQLEAITDSVWKNLFKLPNKDASSQATTTGSHEEGVNRTILTAHLCSLDIQNYLTVQF
jgi:Ca2+-binding EF-hand superfamily protein